MLRSSLASVAMLTLTVSASAQLIPLYPFSQSVGTYVPLTGGTVLGTTTATSGAAGLDDITYGVTLPFAFPYNGSSYTSVQVQSNGHVALGTLTTNTYTPLSSTIANAGYVAACGRDLQGGFLLAGTRTLGSDMITGCTALGPIQVGDIITGTGIPAGTTVLAIVGTDIQMSAVATANSANSAVAAAGPWSEMRWEVQGSSPNQVFIAQWSNFRRWGTTLATTQHTNLNFQIHLHENGQVQCVYGACDPGLTTYTTVHQVGLRGPTNVFATDLNLRANVKGTNDDWSLSNAGTTNAQGMLFNNVAPANVIPNGLTYTWDMAVGTLAANTSLGFGCGGSPLGDGSFYELFNGTTSVNDLANTSFTLNWTGSGYAVIPGASALVPPVGTPLTSGDDVTFALTLPFSFPCPRGNITQAWLCTNGWLSFQSTTSTDLSESVAELLANGTRLAFLWDDMNTNAGGTINAELDGGGVYQITFTNVAEYSTTNQNNVQVSLWPNGNIEVKYGAIALLDGLVGFSTGVAATDPGNVDLSTALPLVITTGFEVLDLSLAAVTRPITGTSWDLSTQNIPDLGGLFVNLELLGLADPNIPDLFFIGAPGCGLRGGFDVIGGPSIGLSSTQARSLPIPASPALVGFELFATSAALAAPGTNALGIITSNTIKGTIGDL